ncbi:MAG TPA: hypothetical protein VGB55_03135 [Tepidisphaeraceae bacterium]|jgi:hypothetical protein
MKTLNIRLTADEVEAIKVLRAAGENVSALLRQTLITHAAKQKPRDVRAADLLTQLDAVYEEHPGPEPDYIQRGIDTSDREQVSAYLREQITRKHREKE